MCDRPDGPGRLEGAEQLRAEEGGAEARPKGAAQARRCAQEHDLLRTDRQRRIENARTADDGGLLAVAKGPAQAIGSGV